jgi:hypothetical protein
MDKSSEQIQKELDDLWKQADAERRATLRGEKDAELIATYRREAKRRGSAVDDLSDGEIMERIGFRSMFRAM